MNNKFGILPNTFQTPNVYTDEVMNYLTGDEYKVLSFGTRHILGWRERFSERSNYIRLNAFVEGFEASDGTRFNGCGLSLTTVRKHLKTLNQYRLLITEGKPTSKGMLYTLGDNPDIEALQKRVLIRKEQVRQRSEKAVKAMQEKRQGVLSHKGVLCDNTPPLLSHNTPPLITYNTPIKVLESNLQKELSPTSVGEVDKSLFSTSAVTPTNPITTPKATDKPKKAKTKTPNLVHFSEVEHLWDSVIGDWKPEAEDKYRYIGQPNTTRNQDGNNWTYPFPQKFDDKDWPIDEPERYRNWLKARPGLIGQLPELKGKILVCDDNCDLNSCHGNVLLHALRYPLVRKHDPIFDLVAMKSFDLKNTEGLDDQTSKRIGQLVKWLKGQDATISQVSYFYQWYDEKYEDIHPPNNPSSFGPHWHACKQEALARKAKKNGTSAESPMREKTITFPKPAPDTHFEVQDNEGNWLGYFDVLQKEAEGKGIPYSIYVEQLRAQRSAAHGTQPNSTGG